MTDQAHYWRTVHVAPPPNNWIAIFKVNGGIEVRDVAAVFVQEYLPARGDGRMESVRAALAVATFDGLLIPARDQDGFAGEMSRADYEAAATAK